jgi:hypothetical protein
MISANISSAWTSFSSTGGVVFALTSTDAPHRDSLSLMMLSLSTHLEKSAPNFRPNWIYSKQSTQVVKTPASPMTPRVVPTGSTISDDYEYRGNKCFVVAVLQLNNQSDLDAS